MKADFLLKKPQSSNFRCLFSTHFWCIVMLTKPELKTICVLLFSQITNILHFNYPNDLFPLIKTDTYMSGRYPFWI